MYLTSFNVFYYFVFIISLLAGNVFCFQPTLWIYQSDILIGSKIYYFESEMSNSNKLDNAFYFDIDTLEYTPVNNSTIYSSSVVNPKNNNVCFLVAYFSNRNKIYQFNSATSKWSMLETTNRSETLYFTLVIRTISDNKEKIYFFELIFLNDTLKLFECLGQL